jgi:hypothetical protein
MSSITARMIVLEVAAAILLVGGTVALVTGDVFLPGADVHPLWIPVMVFSARYAVRGLFISFALCLVALATASLIEHGTMVELATRTSNVHDMIALLAATLVAWTAMTRDGRLTHMGRERDEVTRRLRASEETVGALSEVVGVLRYRLDRIDLSITMWRQIARRMDHGPLPDAAAAALELASVRTGAAAGVVQRYGSSARLQPVATFGQMAGATSDISRDRTAENAVAFRRAALRSDLADPLPEDSDVAVPILDRTTGAVIGVLAMREAPPARLHAAEVRDLEVVAAWLADSFPNAQVNAGGTAC